MSTLSDTLRRMASLVWPRRCAVCGGELPAGADTICTMCRYTAPLTGYWRMEDNPLAQRLDALAGVGRAAALIFFSGGGWRESIHGFKYGGLWRSARTLGRWLGAEMKSSGLYDDIDLVVPVPLHWRKRLVRGYNQSEYLAEGIAAALGVAVDRRSVRRSRYTASQALKPHRERAGNVEGAFAVRHPERLAGKHVLLVDDVMTTGSTLASCAQAIVQAVPDCRISIAVLAVSRRELGLKE